MYLAGYFMILNDLRHALVSALENNTFQVGNID